VVGLRRLAVLVGRAGVRRGCLVPLRRGLVIAPRRVGVADARGGVGLLGARGVGMVGDRRVPGDRLLVVARLVVLLGVVEVGLDVCRRRVLVQRGLVRFRPLAVLGVLLRALVVLARGPREAACVLVPRRCGLVVAAPGVALARWWAASAFSDSFAAGWSCTRCITSAFWS
jgi:hypothetical protein